MQLLNSKILSNDKNTRYSNKKAQDTRVTCAFCLLQLFRTTKMVEMRGFVANIVCVITERKCLHFKAECQPGYRGSRCKATARLLPCEIPADNKKQAVSTACFFGGDAGFVANIVCVITERKCLHFKAKCQPGYRGSRCKATAR